VLNAAKIRREATGRGGDDTFDPRPGYASTRRARPRPRLGRRVLLDDADDAAVSRLDRERDKVVVLFSRPARA
jgi:hypothetical protein